MKDFSWGIVAAVAVGVLLLFIVVKAVSPSLPASVRKYLPNVMES